MKKKENPDDERRMQEEALAETVSGPAEEQGDQRPAGEPVKQPSPKKAKAASGGLRSFLGGGVLASEKVLKHLPLLFLIVFFGILLITNRYWSQRTIRQMEAVQDSIKELKAEAVTWETELMKMNRPSEIAAKVKENGLELLEPQVPARKIKVKRIDNDSQDPLQKGASR